ncbi:MAG: hypothetical protein KC733_11105 [Candidatus Omnitrophica bacterium]|nr:hypothetical protein [Candidatus Omnitrophota bacterium]
MKKITEEEKRKLNIALNEAILISVQICPYQKVGTIILSILSLCKDCSLPDDKRVQFTLKNVGRVVASKRLGRWNDQNAKIVKFKLQELPSIIEEFGESPIYGEEFFGDTNRDFQNWKDRLSLNWEEKNGGKTNSLFLFQDGGTKHLDLIIWFDELNIETMDHNQISIEEFISGNQRWFEALKRGDKRALQNGINPYEGDEENENARTDQVPPEGHVE